MKKLSLILALSLVFVLAFAGAAMAAQLRDGTNYDGTDHYAPTATGKFFRSVPAGTYNDAGDDLTFGHGDSSTFTADNATTYPYEIYLPNEKNPENYRIHTNYTKDTDACASCHATHTAVGESLLQWYTVYDTCMACHDGTVTTTYNVWGGEIGSTGTPAFGGMFGAFNSASSHNVSGTLSIAAAPGGSTVEEVVNIDDENQVKRWTAEFGCQSCHSPHGQGGNARILHPDPNGWATANKAAYYTDTGLTLGVDTIDATTTGLVYDPGVGYKVYQAGEVKQLIKGYPYSPSFVKADGSPVYGISVDNTNGYSVITGNLSSVDRVYATPSLKVVMDIDNYLQSNESVQHKSGMNTFCGACHADYNTENVDESGSNINGTYSEAFRHKVGGEPHSYFANKEGFQNNGMKLEDGKYIYCLTCHVAHGTGQEYWKVTTTGYTDAQLVEISGSSALKRAPNMATCEACHEKGEGAEGYNVLSGQTGAEAPAQEFTTDTTVVYTATATATAAANGDYVGQDECAKCHEAAVEKVNKTGHGDVFYNGLPTGSKLTYNDLEQAYFDKSGNTINITSDDQIAIWTKSGANAVLYTKDTGETIEIATWDSATDTFTGVDGTEDWNLGAGFPSGCAAAYCHTTGRTGFNDEVPLTERPGIQCEACHGPGADHAKYPTTENIFNPAVDGTGAASNAVCGACHTANEPSTEDDMWTYGVGMEPEASAYNMLALNQISYYGDNGTNDQWTASTLAGVVYNAKLMLWEDGVATNGNYGTEEAHHPQYTEYVNSPHYETTSGPGGGYRIACGTCHDVHGPENAALTVMESERLCESCHTGSYALGASVDAVMFGGNHAFNQPNKDAKSYFDLSTVDWSVGRTTDSAVYYDTLDDPDFSK